VRIQSSHHLADRGLDPYFTPPEAVASLLHLEAQYLSRVIWEPVCGDGAIARPLRDAGYEVIATDLVDYGWDGCRSGIDYLTAEPPPGIQGIITNPPYQLAAQFAVKALKGSRLPGIAIADQFPRKHSPAALLSGPSTSPDLDLVAAPANDAPPQLARAAGA
jgi:hypothetical protein